jgi:hypothetical protein
MGRGALLCAKRLFEEDTCSIYMSLVNKLPTNPLPKNWLPATLLDRHVCLSSAVQDGIHSFDHRPFQPSLHFRCLFCVALDDHLIVTGKYREGPWTFASTLPQKH